MELIEIVFYFLAEAIGSNPIEFFNLFADAGGQVANVKTAKRRKEADVDVRGTSLLFSIVAAIFSAVFVIAGAHWLFSISLTLISISFAVYYRWIVTRAVEGKDNNE